MRDILFCNLTIIHNKKQHLIEKVVYVESDELWYRKRYLDKLKIKEPVKVIKVDVIKIIGTTQE